MQIIGYILIIFAVADFGLSWLGINLTPFLPPEISRFSPIAIVLIGGFLVNQGQKKEQSNEGLRRFVNQAKKELAKTKKTKKTKKTSKK